MMIKTNPPIWILTGAREGDNAQLRVLAKATELAFVEKNISYNGLYRLPNMLKDQGLWTVRPASRGLLQPPWPKIVMSVGRRSVPVMRWIKQQSGSMTRLVHIGRPRTKLDLFDLIITTPQYRLPTRPNIMKLPLPLSRLRGVELEHEAEKWHHLTNGLEGPFTSLLVGGDTDSYEFNAQSAARLGAAVSAHVKAKGGSVMVTTSPRTSVQAEQALSDALKVPAYFYRWSEAGGANNPFLGLLALADDIVVTSDSASLLSDAVIADKPIWLFDTPIRPRKFGKVWLDDLFSEIEGDERTMRQPQILLRVLRKMGDHGLVNPPRRMARVIDALAAEQLLCWLGDDEAQQSPTSVLKTRCENMLDKAVARIHALCD